MLTRILLCLCWVSPTFGNEKIIADITGDGLSDVVQVIDTEQGWQHVIIDSEQAGTIFMPRFASANSMAAQTNLEVSSGGGLQIEYAHIGIGRHKWILTVKLAYRDSALRIAGVTYVYYDTLDLDAGGTCDVNLLTGKGVYDPIKGSQKTFTVPEKRPLAHLWSVEQKIWQEKFFPEYCFG